MKEERDNGGKEGGNYKKREKVEEERGRGGEEQEKGEWKEGGKEGGRQNPSGHTGLNNTPGNKSV